MRLAIVGLGNQGNKRMNRLMGATLTTVDPFAPQARYRTIEDVPLNTFDAAFVCTPNGAKLDIVRYLLSNGKHVLVEKPLLASDGEEIRLVAEMARRNRLACYTAYNHRFEPHILRLKEILSSGSLGSIYLGRFFYGNGTAMDVRGSGWRDRGLGGLGALGAHLLDLVLFFFGPIEGPFELRTVDSFETRAWDHVLFGSQDGITLELEATLLSWRNTFCVDIYGELGSAHVDCLCKWGPSTLRLRKRVFPSGRPEEKVETVECPDPTWELEHEYFEKLCEAGGTNVDNDVWINAVLTRMAQGMGKGEFV